eukprot:3747133-Rhodomonas_salina.5
MRFTSVLCTADFGSGRIPDRTDLITFDSAVLTKPCCTDLSMLVPGGGPGAEGVGPSGLLLEWWEYNQNDGCRTGVYVEADDRVG